MASLSVSGKPLPVLSSITRKKIGDLLQKYDPSKDDEPIDCFYFQGYTHFHQDTIKMASITDAVETFLRQRESNTDKEKWYKLVDWWPLTYFLDAVSVGVEEGGGIRSETDRELERRLNDIREKLRATLRKFDLDIPIIIMRACKYNNWIDITSSISCIKYFILEMS